MPPIESYFGYPNDNTTCTIETSVYSCTEQIADTIPFGLERVLSIWKTVRPLPLWNPTLGFPGEGFNRRTTNHYLTVLSANITALETQLPTLPGLTSNYTGEAFTLTCCQEVRIPEAKISAKAFEAASQGLCSAWGRGVGLVDNKIGKKITRPLPGGVAAFFRPETTIIPVQSNDTVGNRLMQTSRFQHLLIPASSDEGGAHLLHIYAPSGQCTKLREAFLTDVFQYAASLGPVPVLIVGDFNTEVGNSPCLQEALTSQIWADVGWEWHMATSDDEDSPAPATFQNQSDWNDSTATRIDLLFANQFASPLVEHFELRDDHFPGHRTIEFQLCITTAPLTGRLWKKPRQWKELPPANPANEYELATRLLAERADDIEQAALERDPQRIWDIWQEILHAFFEELCGQGQCSKGPPKGRAPEFFMAPLHGNPKVNEDGRSLTPQQDQINSAIHRLTLLLSLIHI